VAEDDGQDVPEVPLPQLREDVHLPQAHLSSDQPRQRHGGPELHGGPGQRLGGLQLLLQARALADEHVGRQLAHGVDQLQRRRQREVDGGRRAAGRRALRPQRGGGGGRVGARGGAVGKDLILRGKDVALA